MSLRTPHYCSQIAPSNCTQYSTNKPDETGNIYIHCLEEKVLAAECWSYGTVSDPSSQITRGIMGRCCDLMNVHKDKCGKYRLWQMTEMDGSLFLFTFLTSTHIHTQTQQWGAAGPFFYRCTNTLFFSFDPILIPEYGYLLIPIPI